MIYIYINIYMHDDILTRDTLVMYAVMRIYVIIRKCVCECVCDIRWICVLHDFLHRTETECLTKIRKCVHYSSPPPLQVHNLSPHLPFQHLSYSTINLLICLFAFLLWLNASAWLSSPTIISLPSIVLIAVSQSLTHLCP